MNTLYDNKFQLFSEMKVTCEDARMKSQGTDYTEIERAYWLHKSQQCEDVIRRIHNGTYGVCEVCQKPLDPERLVAWPFATTCVQCSQKK